MASTQHPDPNPQAHLQGAPYCEPAWEAADFLKQVTDIVPSIIYVFNQQTQSNEYTNRSLAETMGYNAKEIREMGADLLPRITHPDDLMRIVDHFHHVRGLEDGQVAQCEYRVRHKNGSWVWLLSNDTVFQRDVDGEILRHIGSATNITAQKNAEENARREHRKAETTNDELMSFAYSVTHDLKSPSNTLAMLLEELLTDHSAQLDEDARNLVNMAQATVGRMGALVDDVLNYTGVINQDMAPSPVLLDHIVAQVTEDLRTRVRESGARIETHNLPKVQADPVQLRILFQNLIENALKFCREGEAPKVEITACPDADSGMVDVTVRDEGVGIDPAKHAQVFQVFKRLHASDNQGGTGLGLAICRRIAANHGTEIKLASAPGEGAAFTVRLALV